MKYFLSACVFLFAATQFTGIATQMVPTLQPCTTQEECETTQCCSGYPVKGAICINKTVEGGKCHLEDKVIPIFGTFVVGPCPCAAGLTCVQQGKKKNDGICQLPAVVEPVDEPAEVPAEEPAEVPAEEPAEVPAEEPAEVPAEEPAEVPAEEPAAVDDAAAEEPAAVDDTPAEEPAAEAGDSSASDSAAAAE